jgi:hypothetical protein
MIQSLLSLTHDTRTTNKRVKEDQANLVSLWPRPALFYRPVFLLWALSYATVGSNFLMVYATPSNKDKLSGRPTCCKRSFDCSTASKGQVLFSPPSKLTGPYRPGRASERATKRSVWACSKVEVELALDCGFGPHKKVSPHLHGHACSSSPSPPTCACTLLD